MIEIKRLVLGVYQVNCFIIKKEGHVLIIDPGARSEKVQSEILENEKVDAILLTHGHFDHIGAVDELANLYGCPIYISEADQFLITHPEYNFVGKRTANIQSPVQFMSEGKLEIQNFSLMIFEAPGHTEGCVLIQLDQHLFTGDVLFREGIGRVDLYSGSDAKMKNSLKLFMDIDEDIIVYPGHGEFSTIGYELMNNSYLQKLKR